MIRSRWAGCWLLSAVLLVVNSSPLWAQAEGAARDAAPDAPAAPAESETESSAGATESRADATPASAQAASAADKPTTAYSLTILGLGIVIVLGLIIGMKVNAFIALITAAIAVSLMAPGDISDKIGRVANAFGSACGGIAIVIALAAVIGKCMLDSGAADRIVRAFVNLMGEKRSPLALMGSGYVLAVPVFFDTVFYLLVPLARSLYRRTHRNYLLYILAIGAGGAITHTLVPPTPGPLLMAQNLSFDVGVMIMVGAVVALPAAIAGLIYASLIDSKMNLPMRSIGSEPEPEALDDAQLPSLFVSLLPVVLPVLLISTNTILKSIADAEHAAQFQVEDFDDLQAWRSTVAGQAEADDPSPGRRVVAMLDPGARQSPAADEKKAVLDLLQQASELSPGERQRFIDGLNRFILANKMFHADAAFLGVPLNDVAKELVGKPRSRMDQAVVERLNRALLESAYPERIEPHVWNTPKREAANVSALFGNANLALLLSTIIALWTLVRQRGLSRTEMAKAVEIALMSGGVIILITAAGGAFGAMLNAAQVGDAIKDLFNIREGQDAGLVFLVLGFAISAILKIAQGSSTVAMITASAMLASISSPATLGFHPVYLATAIGAGSLIGSWMNDSGFWIFAKMGGLTEVEALKSWTILLIVMGFTSFVTTLVLATVLPLTGI